jgi:hypothetical protein
MINVRDLIAVMLLLCCTYCAAVTITVDSVPGQGWEFVEETPTGSGALVTGPGSPPYGVGSALLKIDSTGREILTTGQYAGTRLDAITELSFYSYIKTGSYPFTPTIQLNVDYDNTDANTNWQGRLVFEPYFSYGNAAIQLETWQKWEGIKDPQDDAAHWWASGAPGNTECPQSDPCTWNEVLAAFPNAAVHLGALGHIMLRAGGPWPNGGEYYVDGLTITVSGSTKTFNFEPGAVQCGTKRCPRGDMCCQRSSGAQCYNPSTHTCFGGTVLCGINDRACGQKCYNPATHDCIDNQYLCPKGYRYCRGACYNPTRYQCCPNKLCLIGDTRCCAA